MLLNGTFLKISDDVFPILSHSRKCLGIAFEEHYLKLAY